MTERDKMKVGQVWTNSNLIYYEITDLENATINLENGSESGYKASCYMVNENGLKIGNKLCFCYVKRNGIPLCGTSWYIDHKMCCIVRQRDRLQTKQNG